jgi:hypothetical protein
MPLISQHPAFSRILRTNQEIAFFYGVSVSTVSRWKEQHPELQEAIDQAVSGNCDRVESSLLYLAIRGDMAAIQFYLKNHRPDKWREKKHIDMHASGRIQLEYPVLDVEKMANLSPEQKAEFSKTCRAYQEAVNALALMSASVSDGESDKD